MSPHNLQDHPHFHECSSCNLIVIVRHSHQQNLCRNSIEIFMECLPISPSLMPLSTDVAHWVVKGANVEIPSTCACMCQNLTWIDKTHAFMVWDGFKVEGCMSFMHNVWYRPYFHQHSSCNLTVIIHHSHQWNLFQNSLEMSWNVFHWSHHQFHFPPMLHVEQWMGPMLKSLQLVPICVEIWHG